MCVGMFIDVCVDVYIEMCMAMWIDMLHDMHAAYTTTPLPPASFPTRSNVPSLPVSFREWSCSLKRMYTHV